MQCHLSLTRVSSIMFHDFTTEWSLLHAAPPPPVLRGPSCVKVRPWCLCCELSIPVVFVAYFFYEAVVWMCSTLQSICLDCVRMLQSWKCLPPRCLPLYGRGLGVNPPLERSHGQLTHTCTHTHLSMAKVLKVTNAFLPSFYKYFV